MPKHPTKSKDDKITLFKAIVFNGLTSSVTKTLTAPLEQPKLAFQMQVSLTMTSPVHSASDYAAFRTLMVQQRSIHP